MITATKAAGVGRIIYTSAPKATTSELLLAPEHKATEEFLVASGVSFTILRNNWYTETYAGELDGNIRDGLLAETNGELAPIIGRPTTLLAEGLAASV